MHPAAMAPFRCPRGTDVSVFNPCHLRRHSRASFHHPDKLALQHAQNGLEVVPPLEDLSVHADDAVLTLPQPQFRMLFDPVERVLRCPAKNRENRDITQTGNSVIPPFAGSDHAPIERKDVRQFAPVKSNLVHGCPRRAMGILKTHAVQLRQMRGKSSRHASAKRPRTLLTGPGIGPSPSAALSSQASAPGISLR